jgi:hypothetical protein
MNNINIDKRIKNEQWPVEELVSKITKKEINKPQYQRKKKWDMLPNIKNDNNPNNKAYIQFLYDTENSVHVITFGQEHTLNKICYSNIDGNNRINAIMQFMTRPFDIFSEYFDELFKLIRTISLSKQDIDNLINIFKDLSYTEIINFKYTTFFQKDEYKDLYSKIKIYRDDIEKLLEDIQTKLKIKGSKNFDSSVKINVNIFIGYDTDELCKIFEDINKYNSKLTETELLACRLFNESDFEINNNVFKTKLEECIKEYYNNKATSEVLNCFIYDIKNTKINAHDFIVGFQDLCSKKYRFISKTDADGLSLYFKMYKALYGSYISTFTSKNVNDFIEQITYSCNIFEEVINSIFDDKINEKLFTYPCSDKIKSLKKNNLFMILCCIIGFKNKNTDPVIIKKNLEQCLLYHFMISELKNKDKEKEFKNHDSITYTAGGAFIENAAKNLLSNPTTINKLTKKIFAELISELFIETNNPYARKLETGKNRNDKRRKLKFFEKILMFYFYKEKIPSNRLRNTFSIEHICPNSCEWYGELDKDRTGNLIPIISGMNSSRGNRHISEYNKDSNNKSFFEFIKEIIPKENKYDSIVSHNDKKPTIINNILYNKMCEENEEKYKDNFINTLFNLE